MGLKHAQLAIAALSLGLALPAHAKPATVTVRTEPPGLMVVLDDQPPARAPLHDVAIAPGKHTVQVRERCLEPALVPVELPAGAHRDVLLRATLRTVPLVLSVRTASALPLDATVTVDGEVVGQAGRTLQLPVCAQRLEVRTVDGRQWQRALGLADAPTTTQPMEIVAFGKRELWLLHDSQATPWLADPAPQLGSLRVADWEAAALTPQERGKWQRHMDAQRKAFLTMESLLERNPRDGNGDLYFRLASAWQEAAHFTWLTAYADWRTAHDAWQQIPTAQRPPEPPEPLEDVTEALGLYEKVLQERAEYLRLPEVLYWLGVDQLRLAAITNDAARWRTGLAYLDKQLRQFPSSPFAAGAHFARAEALALAGELAVARDAYAAAAAGGFKTAYATYKLAWLACRLGDKAKGLTLLRSLQPESPALRRALDAELAAMAAE